MAKDAYYFSHDSNAHDDPKCVLLIDQLGLEGYGIYWLLVEILRDQENYTYPLNLLPAIAKRYNTSAEKISSVIKLYGLFDNDEDYFWSPSLLKRMERVDYIRAKASEAGKISAAKRLLNSGSTDVQQTFNSGSTKKRKEKKEKESTRNNTDPGKYIKGQHGG